MTTLPETQARIYLARYQRQEEVNGNQEGHQTTVETRREGRFRRADESTQPLADYGTRWANFQRKRHA